ncbi:Aste57867_15570 [Aphanomyces stellatus]|uniref:Aste57867_15570 protein n=1 Tax=Aphanomyces stellatus TaxID=120398 RepID=A0A485L3Q4_9STRA|nr:hypothetical protein As57867_015514 [Aphanomyces stellatus]VFT92372.1 Aste57867_15570 [Aphanomyces stellatus]
MPDTNPMTVWAKLDIRRLPTLVKEVDALAKNAVEIKKTYSDTQMETFLSSLEARIDEVDELRRDYPDDPRVMVVEKQLFRLREVRVYLCRNPSSIQKTRLHEPKRAQVPESSPPKAAPVKPMYKWETRHASWLATATINTPDVSYIALKEPGHYSTRSPVENTLELEGLFEFQIVMTEDEWRWHQVSSNRMGTDMIQPSSNNDVKLPRSRNTSSERKRLTLRTRQVQGDSMRAPSLA